MSKQDQPKNDSPRQNDIPKKDGGDYIKKGQEGIVPPKPTIPRGPREGDLSEGSPGWTPPKEDKR